jgi:2-polyprenyl-6-methoxyphenol hydroxylase-like FAD-dependent oxidoreductase
MSTRSRYADRAEENFRKEYAKVRQPRGTDYTTKAGMLAREVEAALNACNMKHSNNWVARQLCKREVARGLMYDPVVLDRIEEELARKKEADEDEFRKLVDRALPKRFGGGRSARRSQRRMRSAKHSRKHSAKHSRR